MKIHLMALASNFFLFSFGICAKALHPNIFKLWTVGLEPYKASKGVILSRHLVGLLFFKYTAVVMASAQNAFGSFLPFIILRAHSTRVLFFLSATSFCCGVLGTVNCCSIPWSLEYLMKSPNLYSPPWSEQRILMFFLFAFPPCF